MLATGRAYQSLLALQPDAAWPVPSLAPTRGSVLEGDAFDRADAVLHLGPPSAMTTSRLPAALCEDAGYLAMRRDRLGLAGISPAQAEQLLGRDCPSLAAK